MLAVPPIARTPKVRPADFPRLQLGLRYPLLTAAYCRWRAEGLFSLIFHECPEISLVEFLDWMYRPTVEPVGVFDGERLAGLGWIFQAYQVDGRLVAEVGAAFFRGTPMSIWRPGLKRLLAHAFDRGYHELYGLSAKGNRAAATMARICGWKVADHLPWNQYVNPETTAIYCLRREDWHQGCAMTYDDFRQFGFVSDLSKAIVNKMSMTAPTQAVQPSVSAGTQISQQQLDVASGAGSRASADYDQFKQLLQPLITQQSALAGGDRQAALAASMPVISQLSSGFQGAKDQIMSMPATAQRDKALQDLNRQMFTTIGGTQAGMVQQAPQTLAGIGTSLGNMSLQELGAQLSGLSGGAQTNQGVGQLGLSAANAQNQIAQAQRQSMLNFFGGLASSAIGLVNPLSKLGGGGLSMPSMPSSPGVNWDILTGGVGSTRV